MKDCTVYRKNNKNNVLVVTTETVQDGFIATEYFWVKTTQEKFDSVTEGEEIRIPTEFLRELP